MLEDEGYRLMGAAFEVYNQLGPGMSEEIYQQSLEIELRLRNIPFDSKQRLTVSYKGCLLETYYTPDLFVFGAIIVEIKSVSGLIPEHEAQLFNYLRIAGHPVGYLINFGYSTRLEWKRFIVSDLKQKSD